VGEASDTPQTLREAQDRFIFAWGQMAAAWGIPRTMAEVHALLYITGEPLCMDDVMERLDISRGSASMSLRGLLEWGVVNRAPRRGARKEYFVAEQDVWDMFRAIVRTRIQREVDPLLVSLFEIRDLTRKPEREEAAAHNQRLDALLGFLQTIEQLGQRFVSPTGEGLRSAADMLSLPEAP